MTRVRTLIWLAIGIAVLVAVHFAIDVRTDSAPKGLRRNSLVPMAEKANLLGIERQDGQSVRLSRDSSWKIVKPYSASAEQSAVLRLTDALAFVPIMDEMTDAELLRIGRTRRDFGLENPRLVVTVGRMTNDATAVPVRFGSPTPAGDGVYATVGEHTAVYIVSSNVFAAVNLAASDFRRRRVFSVESADVASVDVKNGTGNLVCLVRADKSWKMTEPHEGAVSSERVNGLLDSIVRIEAQGFAWPTGATNETSHLSESLLAGYGFLEDSVSVVMLKCADGKECRVSFGREADNGLVYALTPDGAVVTVPSSVRASLVAGMSALVDSRFFPLESAAVSAISLDDGGVTYLLSRNADGVWRLDAPVSAPADGKAIGELVSRMLALKSSDVVADGVRVSIGTNAEPVSVSRQALFAGAKPEDLRAKEIVNIDPKLVKRVVVTERGAASVSAVFDSDRKAWGLEGSESVATAEGEALSKLVAALNPLAAIRVVRLKVTADELGVYGLDKPFRTVAVDQTAEGSVRRNILIGDVTDGGRYATLGASDAVFVISSESAAALLAPIAK